MLLSRTTTPEFIYATAFGDSPEYLKKYTSLCDIVSKFPDEYSTAYKWKSILTSSDPLNSLRDFVKEFVFNALDFDTQTVQFYVDKVNNFPQFGKGVVNELQTAFNKAQEINQPTPRLKHYKSNVPLHQDDNLLNDIADALLNCASPCNYFNFQGDTIGVNGNVTQVPSSNTSALWDTEGDLMQQPINVAVKTFNKIKPTFVQQMMNIKVATERIFRTSLSPFFTQERIDSEKDLIDQGNSVQQTSYSFPYTTDMGSYFATNKSSSDIFAFLQQSINDCSRLYSHNKRFNYNDPQMNLAKARPARVYLNTDGYPTLIDMTGKDVPTYTVGFSVKNLGVGAINPVAYESDDLGTNYNFPPKNPTNPTPAKHTPNTNTNVDKSTTLGGDGTAANGAVPSKGEYNKTAQRTLGGDGIERYAEVTQYNGQEYIKGSMSTFGGPNDTGMTPTEGLAVDPTMRGRQLDPNAYYISARWNYDAASASELRNYSVEVVNPSTGKSITLPPNASNPGKGIVDWGPNTYTGRSFDLSPGLANDLGVNTNDNVLVRIIK